MRRELSSRVAVLNFGDFIDVDVPVFIASDPLAESEERVT